MAAGFLSTRPRSLERPARIVEPDVASGNHLARHVHVIVFDKYQVSLEFAVLAQVNDVLDVALALVVARMGFARKNKLDWPFGVLDQPDHVLELLEN